jgi:hypothetical protein
MRTTGPDSDAAQGGRRREAKIAPPAAVVTTTPEDGYTGEMPWGFYRDRQGRVMQVSFDFGRRLVAGRGYAPHRTPAGQTEILAGRLRLRRQLRRLSGNGRTRRRFSVLDGQVRLHSFGWT